MCFKKAKEKGWSGNVAQYEVLGIIPSTEGKREREIGTGNCRQYCAFSTLNPCSSAIRGQFLVVNVKKHALVFQKAGNKIKINNI